MVDVSNQKGDENAQLPIGKMLGEVLAEKKKRNPYYSLRSLARDSGVSHTYLSFLMHNKKRITQTALLSLLRKLPVDPSKRDELIKSSAQWHLPMEQVPTNPVQTYEDLELVQFEVITQWYHLAILEFTLTKGFKANYQWVANRLGIPTRTARTAVERLKRLGLLREEEGKWVKTHARLNFPTQAAHPAIRRFHKQMIAKAEQALDC